MTENISWEQFIELCCKAIIDDENYQNRIIEKFWNEKLFVRVEEGKAIKNVLLESVRNVGGYNIVTFYTNEKTGQFRTGDNILITEHDKDEHPNEQKFSTKGVITKIERTNTGITKIEVEVYYKDVKFNFEKTKKYFVDEAKKDLSKIICKVLKRCVDRKSIEKILLGLQKEKDNFKEPLPEFKNFCINLNPSQEEAIKKSSQIKQYGFYYIQGPPGTGKTVTLARLSVLLSKYGSVGMIAFTHRAINKFVDTVCNYITSSKIKNIEVYRIANDYQLEELSNFWGDKEFLVLDNNFPISITKRSIYAATIHKFAASYKDFQDENTKFDWLIFDEAGQISIPYIIASMFFGKRFIFCGDHKQLSPVVSLEEKHNKKIVEILKTSVLQQLVKQYGENSCFQTTLNVTYRLNNTIAEFPNKVVYSGKIQVKHNYKEKFVSDGSIIGNILEDDKSIIFIEIPKIPEVNFSTGLNEVEAYVVAEVCKYLKNYYKKENYDTKIIFSEKIGVVSPYRNQCQEINNLVRFDVADTVERFQGQERDVMIISYARISPPKDDRIDFIYNPNRLNVAITRAKKKLIIVGNRKLFINGTKLFREYFSYLLQKQAIKRLTKDDLLYIIGRQKNKFSKTTVISSSLQNKIANRYVLEYELHRGSMGILYLAKDTKNNTKVVLKKITGRTWT